MDQRGMTREPNRRHGEVVIARFDGSDEHPIERTKHENKERTKENEASYPRASTTTPPLRRRSGVLRDRLQGDQTVSAFKRRRTRKLTSAAVSTRRIQLPAVACDKCNCVKPQV